MSLNASVQIPTFKMEIRINRQIWRDLSYKTENTKTTAGVTSSVKLSLFYVQRDIEASQQSGM